MKKRLIFMFVCMIALAMGMSSCESKERKELQEEVSAANAECPMYVDEATTATSIALEGDEVVYTYLVDEDYLDLDDLRSNISQIKRNIKDLLKSDADSRKMMKLCKAAGCELVFRYKGDTTDEVVSVSIDPDDVL